MTKPLTASRHTAHPLSVLALLFLSLPLIPALTIGGQATPSPVRYRKVKSVSLASYVKESPPWLVTSYQVDVREPWQTSVPAKLCFHQGTSGGPRYCHEARKNHLVAQYADALGVTQVAVVAGRAKYGVFSVLTAFGGGSSHTWFVSIWSLPSRAQPPRDLLPPVTLGSDGDMRLFPPTSGRAAGFFVTAEMIWAQGEAHADPHQYTITFLRFDPGRSGYVVVDRYVTTKRYLSPAFGGSSIIDAEMPKIDSRLVR